MRLTLRQIINSYTILAKLADADLPIVASYRLSKLFRHLVRELDGLDRLRESLVSKYGKENENGDKVIFPEDLQKFEKELDTVLDDVIEVPFSVLKPEDLGNKLEIKPLELQLIDFIFDDDDQPSPEKDSGSRKKKN